MERSRCIDCRFYYVTWIPATPHGCRAMRFRSQVEPCLVVLESSGIPCQAFQPKPARDAGGARPG